MEDARRAGELAARASYGRLIAIVAARTRDIAGAEDALAEAFEAALKIWPERGIPANPDAWLVTAARRRQANSRRHEQIREAARPDLERAMDELASAEQNPLFDARLRLLFVCAHPAIDPAARAPMMLQTVLGLDAARIGGAFLIAPTTMGQRLVRAKGKIKDARVPFEEPDPQRLAERLPDVLDAVYAAYGTGWDEIAGDPEVSGLAAEALFLARLLTNLLPDEPEPKGLLALMLYCEARRAAGRNEAGAFVPLGEQDPRRWSRDRIVEAEGLLTAASRHARFGRFQCEAAIQSVHVQRGVTGATNWSAVLTLYDLLVRHAPGFGVLVARAAALLQAGRHRDALEALDALPADRMANYQPYWVTRASVLAALNDDGAAISLDRAVGLTRDPAVRSFLATKRAERRAAKASIADEDL